MTTKIVGSHNRSEFEVDPQLAWQRSKLLDSMLAAALVPHPKGVWRMTHTQMNVMDLNRQLAQAAVINKRRPGHREKDILDKSVLIRLRDGLA